MIYYRFLDDLSIINATTPVEVKGCCIWDTEEKYIPHKNNKLFSHLILQKSLVKKIIYYLHPLLKIKL